MLVRLARLHRVLRRVEAKLAVPIPWLYQLPPLIIVFFILGLRQGPLLFPFLSAAAGLDAFVHLRKVVRAAALAEVVHLYIVLLTLVMRARLRGGARVLRLFLANLRHCLL